MINWDNFYVFAAVSICLWLIGAVFALRSSTRSKTAIGFTSGGIIVLAVFITGLWLFLQRPPLRTMGETRLWYSFFMGIAGLLTYIRWQYRWILSFSALLATVFVIINLMKPEIHDQSLMHGETIGAGIRKRLGQSSLGQGIYFTYTSVFFGKRDGKRFMCCSSCPSWLCRCAGTE